MLSVEFDGFPTAVLSVLLPPPPGPGLAWSTLAVCSSCTSTVTTVPLNVPPLSSALYVRLHPFQEASPASQAAEVHSPPSVAVGLEDIGTGVLSDALHLLISLLRQVQWRELARLLDADETSMKFGRMWPTCSS